jgi:hypothetical protein
MSGEPELLEKLREIENFKPGDPLPVWAQPNTWGEYISKVAGHARNEIERLRAIAGAVTAGESVASIKEMLRTPEGIAKLKGGVGG